MRFVHAADLHLDSPLCGLERYEGAPVREVRLATRRALSRLVDLCLEEPADFLLIAGDLYDGDWKDYHTGLFFLAEMARLGAAGIPVYLVRGNHDAESRITRSLRLPEHVHCFSSARPATVLLDRLGVAIHGQSYPQPHLHENLAVGYPPALSGLFNIGLLHTSLGMRAEHAPYAPCALEDLRARGYEYWALGHVHQREVVSREPWVVFPGNLQGRHVQEPGPKGATLVTVTDGVVTGVEARELDVVRWSRCRVDVSGVADASDVVQKVVRALEGEVERAGGRLAAVGVEVVGACEAHRELIDHSEAWEHEIRAAALETAAGALFVERIGLRTRSAMDVEALARCSDPLGTVLREARRARDDRELLAELATGLDELRRRLPPRARCGADGFDLDDPSALRALLPEVEQLLIPRLLEPEEER